MTLPSVPYKVTINEQRAISAREHKMSETTYRIVSATSNAVHPLTKGNLRFEANIEDEEIETLELKQWLDDAVSTIPWDENSSLDEMGRYLARLFLDTFATDGSLQIRVENLDAQTKITLGFVWDDSNDRSGF